MAALPSVGADFGDYQITGVVGRGGMGVVYEAVQRRLSRIVALKVIDPRFADERDYRDRFVREAETLSRLDSPHIIHIYDYGEIDGSLFLATQLVKGGDLGQWLRRSGPMRMALALDVLDQVASALADAHAAGVIHRDLKPNNVLLREGAQPFAYLCDFGIARQEDGPLTTSGTVVGTWAYLSPEQCNGEETTARSDIYALGCLLWTVLSGEPPYRGTDVQVAMQHLNEPVPQLSLPGEVGHRVNLILQHSMAKRPEDRYQRVDQLSADLRAAAEVERSASSRPAPETSVRRPVEATVLRGASATPLLPLSAPARQRPRRRWLALLGVLVGVLVLAGIAGAAAYLTSRGSSSDEQASGGTGGVRQQAVLTRVSYDGNKLSDVAVQPDPKVGAGNLAVFSSTGHGFTSPPALIPQDAAPHRLNGDFDGDGRTDEAILRGTPDSQSITVRLAAANHTFAPPVRWGQIAGMGPDDGYPVSGDFDGNGRGDIAWVHLLSDDQLEVFVKLSDGKAFAKGTLWAPPQPWHKNEMPALNPGDVNADGRTDLVAMPADGSGVSVEVLLSRKGHFSDPKPWLTLADTDAKTIKLMVGDFDGDRTADALVYEPVGNSHAPGARALMLHSTRSSFSKPVQWFASDSWVVAKSWVSPGDFDGDGRCDFARIAPAASGQGIEIWVALSKREGFGKPRVWGRLPDAVFDDVKTLNRVG